LETGDLGYPRQDETERLKVNDYRRRLAWLQTHP